MSKAYEGDVKVTHVKLGAQRLLLASSTAAAITGKITDVTNPPTGWRDCGSLADNKAEVKSKKEIFTLKTGLPETTKMQEIVGLEAQLTAELNEWNFQNIWEVAGRPPIINTVAANGGIVEAGSTRKVIKVGTGEVTSSGIIKGDTVVVDAEASLAASSNMAEVDSVDAVADTITLVTSLSEVPTNGWKIRKVTKINMAYGDTGITKIQAALVFDAKDGMQIVHYIPECAMLGEYSPNMGDTKKQVTLPLTLEAYGALDSEHNKLLVIKMLVFPKQ